MPTVSAITVLRRCLLECSKNDMRWSLFHHFADLNFDALVVIRDRYI